ncbi:MAG: hypothetical protein U9R48_09850 [Chloroflexota bacterium]|nr:hypothetical protein [Chloroflexota bacterium]
MSALILGDRPVHTWLKKISVAFDLGPSTPLLEKMVEGLKQAFKRLGHRVHAVPRDDTDVLITSAPFEEPLPWRRALLFTARRRYHLKRLPALYTLVQVTREHLCSLWSRLEEALAKDPPDPDDLRFPGLAAGACDVLLEQGRRAGPILALERLIQARTKSLRVMLLIGDDEPEDLYHFNLVGAYPRSGAEDLEAFYDDIVMRIVTDVSTEGVAQHQYVEPPVPREVWASLSTPDAMCRASEVLNERNFFSSMIRIADLVQVPAVGDAVADQYSEGCFSTWEPRLDALIATITGSASPVNKGKISYEDLAVIIGVRDDEKGALVRRVEGEANRPPSSEAVEMIGMDSALPFITLDPVWEVGGRVPVVRSKLHGHRGVAAYDPEHVEYVSLSPPYYAYPVTCGSDAQARGIKDAFAHSEALQNPEDQRQVVFTVLPGHGVVIAEKWIPGAAPFETIWQYMDRGYLVVDTRVPQGAMAYRPAADGRFILHKEDKVQQSPCP